MNRYRVTRRAASDLDGIGRFTQARWGRRARADYLGRIEQALSQLAANPSMGRPRPELSNPELSNEIRALPVGRHLVIYRVADRDQIVVIRVVHQAKDYLPDP